MSDNNQQDVVRRIPVRNEDEESAPIEDDAVSTGAADDSGVVTDAPLGQPDAGSTDSDEPAVTEDDEPSVEIVSVEARDDSGAALETGASDAESVVDEDDDVIVISVNEDDEQPADVKDAAADLRSQLGHAARERMRLQNELKQLQADSYEAMAQARGFAEQKAKYEAQVAELESSLKAAADGLQRNHAEFQNYRRRAAREQEEAQRYASGPLLEALLPVLDNFERGAEAAPTADTIDDFYKGIEPIYKQLVSTLEQHELSPIQAVGTPFDPEFHESVSSVETVAVEPDHVVRELRRGYMHKDRLLRPAMVEVSKAVVAADPKGESESDEPPPVSGGTNGEAPSSEGSDETDSEDVER